MPAHEQALFYRAMKKFLFLLILVMLLPGKVWSQKKDSRQLFRGAVINGDTIAVIDIPEVYVFPRKKFRNRRIEARYWKMVRDLKITYPYAMLAKAKLQELNAKFLTLKTDKERKAYAKIAEKELRDEYEGELTNLTISQGKLLIKLIDRETGQTTYALVKELRGTFQAVFWQTIAKIFGSNLKSVYDPKGEDAQIEEILQYILKGYY